MMPPGAKRISSRATSFRKRVFPILWFGFLGLFLLIGFANLSSQPDLAFPFIGVPILMAGFGYLLMRFLIFDLMDEVWDNGHELIVVNGGHVAHVPLSDIMNISYTMFTNPRRATLTLRQPSRWGTEITFSPVWKFGAGFLVSAVIKDLIQRVDAARRLKS